MNPEAAAHHRFGRTPAEALRAALVFAVLGCGLVLGVVRLITRPQSPLGVLLGGVPPAILDGAGIALVAAFAVGGYFKALRSADIFLVTPEGLRVRGALGSYLLAWDNVREAGAAAGGALGIGVRDREAVLRTHEGTPRQREWIRTMEPFGEWDYLYPRADLGVPVEEILGWLSPYLEKRELPGEYAEGRGKKADLSQN
jgi:hypothetical protein